MPPFNAFGLTLKGAVDRLDTNRICCFFQKQFYTFQYWISHTDSLQEETPVSQVKKEVKIA